MTVPAWAASPTACRRRRSCPAARATRRTWRSWNRCRCARSSPSRPTAPSSRRKKLDLRGHAWAGDYDVKTVDISTDYGVTWKPAKVDAPPNKYAWQRFTASIDLPTGGLLRGLGQGDRSKGVTQPFAAANWNPQGYGGNPINRIRVLVDFLTQLNITHVVVIALTAVFLLRRLRSRPANCARHQYVYVPPARRRRRRRSPSIPTRASRHRTTTRSRTCPRARAAS